MAHYRIYTVDTEGHISGPPSVVTCGDDGEATKQAKHLVNGSDAELWDGARFVGRIRPTGEDLKVRWRSALAFLRLNRKPIGAPAFLTHVAMPVTIGRARVGPAIGAG
jgi:hypothetical protein